MRDAIEDSVRCKWSFGRHDRTAELDKVTTFTVRLTEAPAC